MTITRSRVLWIALAALAVLLLSTLLLAAGSLLLLYSESGSGWLAGQALKRSGGAVRWQSMEGSLAGPLTLRGVTVALPDTGARVGSLRLDWQPLALLGGELRIADLALADIEVDIPASAASEAGPPLRPSSIPLPVDVSVEHLQLDRVRINRAGEPLASLDLLQLRAELADRRLQLHTLHLRAPQGEIRLAGELAVDDRMPVDLSIEWGTTVPAGNQSAPLAGQVTLAGQLDWSQRLDIALDYAVQVRGLEALATDLPGVVTARGQFAGWQAPNAAAVEQLSVAFAELPARLAVSATATGLDRDQPGLSLQLGWEALQWPPVGTTPLAGSAAGELALAGSPQRYRVNLQAELAGADLPPGSWTLQGEGDTSGLATLTATGQVLGGELSASGMLSWDPLPAWDLQLQGAGLDPAQFSDGLNGELALSLRTDGALRDDGPAATVHIDRVAGTLLDYPVAIDATARLAGETVEVAALTLHSGANALHASGLVATDALALDWQLRAADPALVAPGARGLIDGNGTLTGSPQAPRLTASLASERLRLDDLEALGLAVELEAGMAADDPLELRLRAGAVSQADAALLDSARLEVSGTLAQHRLALHAAAGEQRLSAALSGGLGEALDNWRGELAELAIDTGSAGSWQLGEGAALALAPDQATLASTCLERRGGGRTCLAANWAAAGTSTVDLQLAQLPLQAWLPEVDSMAEGALRATLGADGTLAADGELVLSPGTVTVPVDRGPRQLAHGGGRLTLRVDPAGLLAVLDVDAPQQGRLDARVALSAMNRLPLAERQPVEGSLLASFPDLTSVAAWVPELASTRGSLDADLALAGSLAQPLATGRLSLSDAAASIPLAGLYVHDMTLDVHSNPDRADHLDISGSLVSGEGRIAITGEADLGVPRVELAIGGERFLVYDTPDVRALLTPDLRVAWQDRLVTLRGTLEIPEADVTPQLSLSPGSASGAATTVDTGSLIAPSPDVVVINGPELVAQPISLPVEIDSAVEIILGPGVNVNAVGFISRIPGAVTITTTPGQRDPVPIAKGQFAIEDGTFRAFGQDLDIESGQIIFPNGPVTEPEVNLRAVRWIDNNPEVTAVGVIVTGPVSAPTLTPFSRPPLEQNEIMSYLLTGRSASGEGGVLSIGTYITPRLYVGYGYNLLESTNEFNTLFSITPRYGVSANVGEADNNVNVTLTYEH